MEISPDIEKQDTLGEATTSEIQMLVLVRYLFERGVRQAQNPAPLNSLAILDFHDSVELFLNLIADHINAKRMKKTTDKILFQEYWIIINEELNNYGKELGYETTMDKLNKARVNLKHYTNLTQTASINNHMENTLDFMKENFPKIFGLQFDAISLVFSVECQAARQDLIEAEKAIATNDVHKSLESSSLAFYHLINDYETRKKRLYRSPYFFGEDFSHDSRYENAADVIGLSRFVKETSEAIGAIQQAVKVLSLNLDFRKYSRFRMIVPEPIVRRGKEPEFIERCKIEPSTKEDAQFCIGFIVECALRLQEFDYEIKS